MIIFLLFNYNNVSTTTYCNNIGRIHIVPWYVLIVQTVCMYVCMYTMYVCIFIKLHITAQSGPVIYSFYATACNPPGGYLS